MKINELPSTIERMWDFVIPSIMEALIAVLIVLFILGNSPLHAFLLFLAPYVSTLKNPEVIKLLSAYGIIKLLPFVLLFILFLIAYAFDKIAHLIGGLLPITLAWNHYGMMARNVSAFLVADIWKYYPNIDNIPDLHRLIDERLARAKVEKDPLFATAIFLEKRFNKLHEHLNFLQFLTIQAVIIPFVGAFWLKADWQLLMYKSLGVTISILLIYALLVRQQFKYSGELEFYRVFNMRTSLQVQMEKPVRPDEQKKLILQQKCKDDFEGSKKDKIISLYWKWK